MSTFQVNVNISLNLCQIPPWRGGFRPWGLAGILSAPVQKFRLYIDIYLYITRILGGPGLRWIARPVEGARASWALCATPGALWTYIQWNIDIFLKYWHKFIDILTFFEILTYICWNIDIFWTYWHKFIEILNFFEILT